MLRRLCCVLLLVLLCVCPALCEEAAWTVVPDVLRPGKLVRLAFTAEEGMTDIAVVAADGSTALLLRDDMATVDGMNGFTWDGSGVAPGVWTLRLTTADAQAETQVTIGAQAPQLMLVNVAPTLNDNWFVVVNSSTHGRLTLSVTVDGKAVEVAATEAMAGENVITWNGEIDGEMLAEGHWNLALQLTDETGFSSTAEMISAYSEGPPPPALATDVAFLTPNVFSDVTCDHDVCYWKLNMGELNEEAIWKVLTQPVTVLDGHDRKRIPVRREPSESCMDYVGEVTCASQAVHILEKGEEWTLIEAYSSSTAYSKIEIYADYMKGYVPTRLLKEIETSQKYGIVIDKLQQRLYLFVDGKLVSTLLCSTGIPTRDSPFNETPAGEFIIVSWTGGFWSGNMYCDMALRINGGILLHEVPCLIRTTQSGNEYRVYDHFENVLGEKASHGCIRVQRELTLEGINMQWLWDHLKRNTKVIIWDEVGRVLGYPDDHLPVYYNPDGGRLYHSVANCPAVASRFLPLSPLTYGQLSDAEFDGLTPCTYCHPQRTRKQIDEINAENIRKYKRH